MLIVGDGIRENLESMVDMLHNFPQLLFTFALVEMQIYEGEGINGRLYIPKLLTHTTEIVRAVVKVADKDKVQIAVDLDEKKKEQDTNTQSRRTLTEDEFLDEIENPTTASLFKSLLSFIDEIGGFPTYRSASVSFRMKDPKGTSQNLTIFVLNLQGDIYFGWLPWQLNKISVNSDIAWEMLEQMATIFSDITVNRDNAGLSRLLTTEEVSEKYDDFTQILKDTVTKIKES